ncbi:hypothetical protein N2W54_002324 [Lotmaria passim]
MSDAATVAKGVQNPVEDAVKVERETVEAAAVNGLELNRDCQKAVDGAEANEALVNDSGKSTGAAESAAENSNASYAHPTPETVAAPESANLQLGHMEAAQATATQVPDSATTVAENKLSDAEKKPMAIDEEKQKDVVGVNAESAEVTDAKDSDASTQEKKKDAIQVESAASEEAKGEPKSPNSLRKQKAAFNVDAKPFSPVTLADPVMQATLVGEANGLSIKVGQWGNQPFVALPHISPTAPVSVGQVPYSIPATVQPQPIRKEGSGAKESLSAFAKPWSPHPEVAVATVPPLENEVTIHPGSWSTTNVEGKDVQTPSPMVPKEASNNSFAHSFSIHPKGLKNVELELYNYICGRCPLKTLYGRLSSRQPDVTMRNVVMDIPPLCVAHLIEQVTKAKVTALCVNEVEGTHYDIWLDKPNMAPVLTESMSGCVWTCPMHHGYAVLGKGEEGKKYLRNYVERLKDSRPEGSNVYDVALVDVKEH